MPARKKYYSYYKKRFYRKFKNYVGKNNYFSTRADIAGLICFPSTEGQPVIKIGNNTYNSIWTYGILSSVDAALLNAFDERKVNGFKLSVVPANDKEMQGNADHSSSIVAGITHQANATSFNQMVDNNKSLILNPCGGSKAYWPVRNQWISNDPDIHDDGCFCVFSSKDMTDGEYGRVYSFKLSVYVTYRNSSRF